MDRLETEAVPRTLREGRTELKLWLRLLSCAGFVEREIAARLRSRFGVSLSRFDYMAQLERAGEDGLSMGELGQKLMVTGGNITGLTDRLSGEGLVVRSADAADRRVQRVTLTEKGRAFFSEMAVEHARWIEELFGGLEEGEIGDLMRLLAHMRRSAEAAATGDGDADVTEERN